MHVAYSFDTPHISTSTLNMADMSCTFDKSHTARSWFNNVVPESMLLICITLDTSHLEMSYTSHFESPRLNHSAPENVAWKYFPLDTFIWRC